MKARIFSTAFLALIMGAIFMAPYIARADEAAALQALRDGEAVLMLRHALAPGTGDPAYFEVDDCSTQRNLNDTGREQARAWKPFLAEHGITETRIFSSQWCRCLETAREMNMGEVTEWLSLNSFFRDRGKAPAQTRKTIASVNDLDEAVPVIMVSHQVNITALTGIFPASNEGVILALPLKDSPDILARVTP